MLKVTPSPGSVHDLLAAPLRDQPLGDTGIVVLVLLVAVAILLFQALRAVLVAVVALLMPALVLFRSLVFVLGLVALIGYGLVSGAERVPDQPAPASPTTRLTPAPTAPKAPTPRAPPAPPPARSSLAAPDR
jgi:hypothetical protein